MNTESFETMLTGGHPNSLGRTLEVVDQILADPDKLEELYNCYFSDDEVVRLRTSNGIKRISRQHPDWLISYIDRLIDTVSKIDQASTQWTLAELFNTLKPYMNDGQQSGALAILKHNLVHHNDWIVLNTTMQTLAEWAVDDLDLRRWLRPHLERLRQETRQSIARRAEKLIAFLKKHESA